MPPMVMKSISQIRNADAPLFRRHGVLIFIKTNLKEENRVFDALRRQSSRKKR